jgi:hypothetical protein
MLTESIHCSSESMRVSMTLPKSSQVCAMDLLLE